MRLNGSTVGEGAAEAVEVFVGRGRLFRYAPGFTTLFSQPQPAAVPFEWLRNLMATSLDYGAF